MNNERVSFRETCHLNMTVSLKIFLPDMDTGLRMSRE